NAGAINANIAAGSGHNGALVLNGSGGITNTNLLTATSGGVLQLNGTTVNNQGGNITATGAGSIVQVLNSTVQGGALGTSASGTMQTVGSATLDGAAHGSVVI